MSETLETNGKYRVRLIADESPDEPYDDGQSPLLRLGYVNQFGWIAEHVMNTGRPLDDDSRIEEAAQRWGSDFRMLEKYLRAYYGTTEIKTWHSGSYWYITYDTAKWRAYVGLDTPGATGHINMDEWRAYCEGDVWGYDVEQNVTWHRDDSDETLQTWESVDSCWGFYGYDYAKEAATEAYNDVINPEKVNDGPQR